MLARRREILPLEEPQRAGARIEAERFFDEPEGFGEIPERVAADGGVPVGFHGKSGDLAGRGVGLIAEPLEHGFRQHVAEPHGVRMALHRRVFPRAREKIRRLLEIQQRRRIQVEHPNLAQDKVVLGHGGLRQVEIL